MHRYASGRHLEPLVITLATVVTTLVAPALVHARPRAYTGNAVAIESYRDAANAEILLVATDGSGAAQNITLNSSANDRRPSWSLDGDGSNCQGQLHLPTHHRLAFESDRDGGDGDIFVVDAYATPRPAPVENLTSLDAGNDAAPAWGSALIAYTNDASGDREIYLIDPISRKKTQITDNAADDANPEWSPDSSQLAFESNRITGGSRQIFVVNITSDVDGNVAPGPVHQVTSGGGAKRDPTWVRYQGGGSDFGGPSAIAYSVEQGGRRYIDVSEVGSPDGPEVVDPFSNPAMFRTFPLTGDPGDDAAPNWSPVGVEIVYASTAGGAAEDIYGLGAKFTGVESFTGPPKRLTFDPAKDTNPDWEPWKQCATMRPQPPIPAPPPRTAKAAGPTPGSTGSSGAGGGQNPSRNTIVGGSRPHVKASKCTIRGGPSNDVLRGTARADVICGAGGNDRIEGRGGPDIIDGGPGNDRINGGKGNDRLIGGPSRDRIAAGRGADSIYAKDGKRDLISGGRGSDKARLDRKRDRFTGVERKIW